MKFKGTAKLRGIVFLCAFVAQSWQVARASTIAYEEMTAGVPMLVVQDPASYYGSLGTDPQLMVRHLKRGSIPFWGLTFTFDAPTGTGFFDYYNANDLILDDLTVSIIPGGFSDPVIFGCGVESDFLLLPFWNCGFTQFGTDSSATVINFSGGPGLPPYSHFALELTGFPANANVTVAASARAAPEPQPAQLFMTGVLVLATAHWLRRSRGSVDSRARRHRIQG